ncbi:MAG TPA: hypothetical protein PLD59_15070 [Tepidisphaeraceae bacterium]|nr:hypothetical protein [Tepidisphaeraceae bacterium]
MRFAENMLGNCIVARFLVVALLATVARADTPATAPSTGDAAIMQTFRDYNAAMAVGDEPTMLSLQHAVSDDQKAIAKAMTGNDLSVGKLKAAVEGKFGADAAKQVAKAVGDVGNDDLEHAKINLKGNKAMIAIGGGGIPMINVDGKWLFDMTEASIAPTPERTQALITTYEGRAKNFNIITAGVKDGKFDDIAQVIEELRSGGL